MTDHFDQREHFDEERNLDDIRKLRRENLLRFAKKLKLGSSEDLDRDALIRTIRGAIQKRLLASKLVSNGNSNSNKKKVIYNLVANICHDSPSTQGKQRRPQEIDPLRLGKYRIQLRNCAKDNKNKVWFEFEGLQVKELMPQQIGNSEAYMLLYKRV